jgi:hypothetical protein
MNGDEVFALDAEFLFICGHECRVVLMAYVLLSFVMEGGVVMFV